MALHNPAVTFTTNVSVIVLPEASVGTLQVTMPVPPSVGSVHDPRMMETLLNVVPAGMASWMLTLLAASGPLLVTSITYVMLEPVAATVGAKPGAA